MFVYSCTVRCLSSQRATLPCLTPKSRAFCYLSGSLLFIGQISGQSFWLVLHRQSIHRIVMIPEETDLDFRWSLLLFEVIKASNNFFYYLASGLTFLQMTKIPDTKWLPNDKSKKSFEKIMIPNKIHYLFIKIWLCTEGNRPAKTIFIFWTFFNAKGK